MPQLIQDLIEHIVVKKTYKGKEIEEKRIHIDHTKIDLFKQYTKKINKWTPTRKIKPYNQLKICVFDLETEGLNPDEDRIILAGIMNQDGKYKNVENNDSEALLIKEFLRLLTSEQWDIIAGYNIMEFDLNFLQIRCKKHGIYFPFNKSSRLKTFKTAQIHNVPIEFYPYYYHGNKEDYYKNKGEKKHTAVIDLYQQVLAWDFVSRVLTSYTLKQAVLQMGLRKEARTELSYPEMQELWRQKKLEKFHEYLFYDLEDSLLLCEKLCPSIYYQKLFLDWNLQSISTAGNGTKWNSILMEAIGVEKDYFEPDEKEFFQGGTAKAFAGLYKNCSKMDVKSLYPSLQKTYGIYSRKDIQGKTLDILCYLIDTRLLFKDIKDKKIPLIGNSPEIQEKKEFYDVATLDDADRIQGAFKIFINSGFGFLGAQGVAMNDYEAAATVTAYGRAVFDLMCAKIVELGGEVLTADTDGVIYSCPEGKNFEIFEKVNNSMPPGIELDFEFTVDAVYVPSRDHVKSPGEGKRKNYLMFAGDKVKKKGTTFRARNVSKLMKDFTVEYLKNYLVSNQSAEEYFQGVLHDICCRKIDENDLQVTRKISKNEVSLVEQGVGKVGEIISYITGTDGKPSKVGEGAAYSIKYYAGKVIEMHDDILATIDPYLEKF